MAQPHSAMACGSIPVGVPLALLGAVLTVVLQGCGGGGGSTTTTTPSPVPSSTSTTSAPGPSPPEWKLNPIVVKGQHMYDSVTNKQFRIRGIGFPNVPSENIEDWIKVLRRIRGISAQVNTVRIYELPVCALNEKACFDAFMKEADHLGFYVLLPGTGTQWGVLPAKASDCKPQTSQGCYRPDAPFGVLGWGQKIVQNFYFPNTLAIVIGNEFDMQMVQFMAVMKAYARDLKVYMNMCNTENDSPAKGSMRQIPLTYASSDDQGDKGDQPKADYMFCGDSSVSVDFFGLNVERWCNDVGGEQAYSALSKWVGDRKYPGGFFFSEMGCAKINVAGKTRTWKQVKDFFSDHPEFDGYAAYTYQGNKDFDMFDGPTADAKEYEDGENFFKMLVNDTKELEDLPVGKGVRPTCPTSILGFELDDYTKVKTYDTGPTGDPKNCPKPLDTDVVAAAVQEAEIVI